MSFWDAASLAAAITIALIGFAANKILDVDFTVFFRRNWKRTKCKKMLAQRKGPWQGTNVQGEIRRAFDLVLLPLGKADKALLPARMDKNFRRRMEGQIELLQRRKLCRDIRMTDIVPLPKNSFRHWNDDGREWRESVLQCSALERLLSPKEGRPIYTIYRKNARLRLLQSRHVRSCDRAGKQTSCYAHKGTISCPSCGAEVELRSQQTVCPYCGGVIQSDFYDWQTEAFEVYEQMGANQQRVLLLLLWGALQYVCLFLCLWLIRNTMISLAAGLGSIDEALYPEGNHPDRMDYSVGTIRLKKVVNTEETTTITAQVYLSETDLPQGRKPYTRKYKRTLVLQRARYPQRRKQNGKLFTERECPSCGANFAPDENHCCSFCGYSFQIDNAKWVVQTNRA